jgi:hypothetical protein
METERLVLYPREEAWSIPVLLGKAKNIAESASLLAGQEQAQQYLEFFPAGKISALLV